MKYIPRKPISKKEPGEIREQLNRVQRPMRFNEAESEARSFLADIENLHLDITKQLFEYLNQNIDDFPKFETVKNDYNQSKVSNYSCHHKYDRCSCNTRSLKTVKNYVPDNEIEDLDQEFESIIGASGSNFTNNLFQQYQLNAMIGSGLVITAGAIFNEHYNSVWNIGLNHAYESSISRDSQGRSLPKSKRDKREQEIIELGVNPNAVLDPNSPFVKEFYKSGFQLVNRKIYKDFLPNVKKTIVDGVASGRAWNQIARDLYKKNYINKLYHWERLVRTEMVRAFDLTARERYAEMGAKYVKGSVTPTRCELCAAEVQNKYYRIDNAPGLPIHPNCRCEWIPVFNLPNNANLVN